MNVINYHNHSCKSILKPYFEILSEYDFETVSKTVFNLFDIQNPEYTSELWYVLILIPTQEGLFFAATQETIKPTIDAIILYDYSTKIKITKTSLLTGYHGWGRLTIVEGSFNCN